MENFLCFGTTQSKQRWESVVQQFKIADKVAIKYKEWGNTCSNPTLIHTQGREIKSKMWVTREMVEKQWVQMVMTADQKFEGEEWFEKSTFVTAKLKFSEYL